MHHYDFGCVRCGARLGGARCGSQDLPTQLPSSSAHPQLTKNVSSRILRAFIVGTCEAGEAASIDEAYISVLIILLVKTCRCCKAKSNSLKPIILGYYARSRKMPCLPWAEGSYQKPRGDLCFLCVFVFRNGAFIEEHGTVPNLLKAITQQETHSTLLDEIIECRSRCVNMFKSSELPQRARGATRDKISTPHLSLTAGRRSSRSARHCRSQRNQTQ
jgi:hypothetical protein